MIDYSISFYIKHTFLKKKNYNSFKTFLHWFHKLFVNFLSSQLSIYHFYNNELEHCEQQPVHSIMKLWKISRKNPLNISSSYLTLVALVAEMGVGVDVLQWA